MPVINVSSNAAPADIKAFLADLTAAGVAGFKKPAEYIAVSFTQNRNMLYSGTDAPCALIDALYIGNDEAGCDAFSKELAAVLQAHLGVEPSRYYAVFRGLEPKEVGFMGTLFSKLS